MTTRMSHRQVLQALSGLMLAMFCSMVSTTVVGTSLPIIVPELGGSQTSYTWVVTMTLLTTAISTPIWGKLADLVNRKNLMILALTIFILASAGAGLSQNTEMLIMFRGFQGLGGGGLAALSQVLMADILSPRERGKYMGLFAGVMAVATTTSASCCSRWHPASFWSGSRTSRPTAGSAGRRSTWSARP
ncbi:MFS transporter [Microbacterium aerolatum]|nr:MFS transporter [Microbacterium aerolatum]MCK3771168.1 MFS transporter [Microbacterium aerolatum]